MKMHQKVLKINITASYNSENTVDQLYQDDTITNKPETFYQFIIYFDVTRRYKKSALKNAL